MNIIKQHMKFKFIFLNFIILLLIILLNSKAKYYIKLHTYEQNNLYNYYLALYEKNILVILPYSLRSFIADMLWIKADEFLHFGPSYKLKLQCFDNSFASNAELISILKLIILFDPTYIKAYEIIAHNLIFYLCKLEEGIKFLQKAIIINKDNPKIHKLYALIGYTLGYMPFKNKNINLGKNQNIDTAIRYYDKAINEYKRFEKVYDLYSTSYTIDDKYYNSKMYTIFKARLLVNLGRIDEALECWTNEKLTYDIKETGLIGEFLEKYKNKQLKFTNYREFIEQNQFLEKFLYEISSTSNKLFTETSKNVCNWYPKNSIGSISQLVENSNCNINATFNNEKMRPQHDNCNYCVMIENNFDTTKISYLCMLKIFIVSIIGFWQLVGYFYSK